MPLTIRVLDLFAGAGGLTAGLHSATAGFSTVAAVEMDIAAAATFDATFGEGIVEARPIEEWLVDGNVPTSVDVVVGGPPCQGFSTLGKRDVEDVRNSLWRRYAETILRTGPKYFVIENVEAFQRSIEFQKLTDETSTGVLRDYDFVHGVLNAADYGAPQARRRAIVIGRHRDLPNPGLPLPTHAREEMLGLDRHKTVGEAFAGIPVEPDMDAVFGSRFHDFGGKRFDGAFSPRELHWSRDYRQLSLDRFRAIPAGGNRFDLPWELQAPCWRKHQSGSADVMGRLRRDRPSVTIRTEFFKPEKGRYIHPTADRAITHYEAAVLQGFPSTHRFVGSRTAIARQIGNAVPIALGAAIGRHLAAALAKAEEPESRAA
ncbi:DNA cytosine methyltransferase [Demequina pelophila]|uniref:DNA cytosine methyltransferase n=1 Tax=Demequina pelophila TaxID=1638984 RepID=UPI0007846BF1